jgi:7,8-dihydroneopterin aldolase/epimerase/oxygenase
MTVFVKNLRVSTIIGIYEKEREVEQSVCVDIEANYDYNKSSKIIDYEKMAKAVERCLKRKKFRLAEDACIFLADFLKERFDPITSIEISISKPEAVPNCLVGTKFSKEFS